MTQARDVSVFIDPFTHHFLRDELFNPASRHNIDNAHAPYFHLRDVFAAHGIEVHTADYLVRRERENRLNVYFSLGMIEHYRALAARDDVMLSGFFTFEAPIVKPSIYRDLRRASRHIKRIYSYAPSAALRRFGCEGLRFEKFHIPYAYDRIIEQLWSRPKTKFLTLLNYNRLCRRTWHELYTERLRALEYFSRFDEIDLFGMGWDKPPYRVGDTWIPATLTFMHRYLREHVPFLRMHPYQDVIRKVWRGVAKSKYEAQSDYTFTICYENMELEGWLNENIFDCFLVGTIPIYLGPPDVTTYVPAECFIDKRQFATYAELRRFLKAMGPAEMQRYRENARDYLSSAMFQPFRKEAFVDIFVRAVEEDTGLRLRGPA